jgi:lipooligosaccharide transport system permease protein
MMFLSGIFFPREQLPAFVRVIADWLPLSVAVDLVRPLFMGRWPEHPLRNVLVLAVFAVVSFWIALALTRKRFRS